VAGQNSGGEGWGSCKEDLGDSMLDPWDFRATLEQPFSRL